MRAPGTSFYSPDWTGGPIPALIQSGQIIALDLFNSAIGMTDEPPSPSNVRDPTVTAISTIE